MSHEETREPEEEMKELKQKVTEQTLAIAIFFVPAHASLHLVDLAGGPLLLIRIVYCHGVRQPANEWRIMFHHCLRAFVAECKHDQFSHIVGCPGQLE